MDSLEEKYLKLLAEYEKMKMDPDIEKCSRAYKELQKSRSELIKNIKTLYKSWLPPKIQAFFETMKAWSKTGFKKHKYSEKRLNICNSCDFFKNKKTCLLCGCYMPTKTKIEGAKCPINKWTAKPKKD